jgi:hypothetical protein
MEFDAGPDASRTGMESSGKAARIIGKGID